MNVSQKLSAITLTVVLTACGGGGGSSGVPSGQTYAVGAAMVKLNTQASNWTVNTTSPNGTAIVLSVSTNAATAGTFPVSGAAALAQAQTVVLTAGTSTLLSAQSTQYVDASGQVPVGSDNGDGTCDIATATTALPTSATIGQSGSYSTSQLLTGCTSASASGGTETATWSLVQDTGTTGASVVELCQNFVDTTTAAVSAGGSQCFEIDPQGNLGTRARVIVTLPTTPPQTVTLRNY